VIEKKLTLLPCAEGLCPECGVDHSKEAPHNAKSFYYQVWFYGKFGRWPTWKDAIAHCNEKVQELWTEELKKEGAWNA